MPTFTAADGTALYYKDWGAGAPIVFSHGWPLNADMWELQMKFLADRGFRCIAHDRRGFGRSEQPWTGYDYDTFADDLHTLLETLELESVSLVGLSMGGGDVVRYLSRHGSTRIAKAVLVSAVTPLLVRREDHPEGVDPAVFDGMRAGLLADRAAFLDGFGPLFTGANRPDTKVSQAMLNWTLSMAFQAGLKGTYDCVEAFSTTDFRGELAKIDVPTLVIHGGDDQVVPLEITSRAAARGIKNARLEIYEGGPHALYFTHADRLNRDLLEFCRA